MKNLGVAILGGLILSLTASGVPVCTGTGGNAEDSGPITFATWSDPAFTCQQQDKIYSNFAVTSGSIPNTTALRVNFNHVDDFDFHTVTFAGNFAAAFTLTYMITVDTSVAPTAVIDQGTAGLDASLPRGNPMVTKTVAGFTGSSMASRTTGGGLPITVSATTLTVTDVFSPNGGVATSISNTFREQLSTTTTVPEPAALGLVGLGLTAISLVRRRQRAS